jgi:glyoxylase-like metal-dependent hydrolase (beta-lactamase superfamily II)
MRIHAIQTGTVAVKKSQRDGTRGNGYMRLVNTMLDDQWTEPLPIFAWVIEHSEGIIVIDTGETSRVSQKGYFPWWHPYYKLGVREWVDKQDEIGYQLMKIGINPDDVRWVVMTHLHTDHAGGMSHFPKSEFILSREEYRHASGLMGLLRGYLPNRWPAWLQPSFVDFKPEEFGPFPKSAALTQAGDVTLVPTPGHAPGHLSVIVQDNGTSYFFAGDTSYTEQKMLDQVVDGVTLDPETARVTLDRILKFAQQANTIYLPSHDPDSANRLMNQSMTIADVSEHIMQPQYTDSPL